MTNGVFVRDGFGFDATKTGTWYFKVYWSGDSSYNEVNSNVVAITVNP